MKIFNTVSNRILALAAVLVLSVATAVLAHQGATGVVKTRMDMMKEVALSMKQLGKIVKGEQDFEEDQIKQAAQIISGHAVKLIELFPEGSTQKPSEAAPAIWEKRSEFDAIFQDMKTRADNLSEKAGALKSGEALAADFKALGETCGACHKLFRIKK